MTWESNIEPEMRRAPLKGGFLILSRLLFTSMYSLLDVISLLQSECQTNANVAEISCLSMHNK